MPYQSHPESLVNTVSPSDTNYVSNEHEDADKYDSYAIPSKIMPYQSHPESYYWVMVLTSSSDTNYVPNEHEDVDQYDSYAISSKIMPC